jgi:hypothetical protein
VLAEMARKVLNRLTEFKVFTKAGMTEIKAGIMKATIKGVVLVAKLPVTDDGGDTIKSFGLESESFADFAGGETAAIGNDICGHGSAAFAVAAVNMLNDALALITAGKVEIDVRPLAAFFGKKTFEEKIHLDGVDGGNAEGVTDGAVGG